MSRTTVGPLLVYYLGATPVFFLIDVGLDLSLRASFLESAAARVGYYDDPGSEERQSRRGLTRRP